MRRRAALRGRIEKSLPTERFPSEAPAWSLGSAIVIVCPLAVFGFAFAPPQAGERWLRNRPAAIFIGSLILCAGFWFAVAQAIK